MKRSTVYLLAAVLLIAGAGVVVYRTWRGGPSQRSGGPGEQSVAGTGPARVLLNEILFQPAPGQAPFVELANMGAEPATLDGFALVNQAGERYALPAGLTVLSGGLLLVRFDGTAQTDGTTLHAPQTGFLQRETGSLSSPAPKQQTKHCGARPTVPRSIWGAAATFQSLCRRPRLVARADRLATVKPPGRCLIQPMQRPGHPILSPL
jgi:hypothetical protein